MPSAIEIRMRNGLRAKDRALLKNSGGIRHFWLVLLLFFTTLLACSSGEKEDEIPIVKTDVPAQTAVSRTEPPEITKLLPAHVTVPQIELSEEAEWMADELEKGWHRTLQYSVSMTQSLWEAVLFAECPDDAVKASLETFIKEITAAYADYLNAHIQEQLHPELVGVGEEIEPIWLSTVVGSIETLVNGLVGSAVDAIQNAVEAGQSCEGDEDEEKRKEKRQKRVKMAEKLVPTILNTLTGHITTNCQITSLGRPVCGRPLLSHKSPTFEGGWVVFKWDYVTDAIEYRISIRNQTTDRQDIRQLDDVSQTNNYSTKELEFFSIGQFQWDVTAIFDVGTGVTNNKTEFGNEGIFTILNPISSASGFGNGGGPILIPPANDPPTIWPFDTGPLPLP